MLLLKRLMNLKAVLWEILGKGRVDKGHRFVWWRRQASEMGHVFDVLQIAWNDSRKLLQTYGRKFLSSYKVNFTLE